jgi:hypothetical protein
MNLPAYMSLGWSLVCLLLGVGWGCAPSQPTTEHAAAWAKLTFDLQSLNVDGLQGPAHGLRALSYEFCIPARPVLAEQVRKIDPTVVVFDRAPGRVGCTRDQFLCIGTTHQPGYRTVLFQLARLSYVASIQEAVFE